MRPVFRVPERAATLGRLALLRSLSLRDGSSFLLGYAVTLLRSLATLLRFIFIHISNSFSTYKSEGKPNKTTANCPKTAAHSETRRTGLIFGSFASRQKKKRITAQPFHLFPLFMGGG